MGWAAVMRTNGVDTIHFLVPILKKKNFSTLKSLTTKTKQSNKKTGYPEPVRNSCLPVVATRLKFVRKEKYIKIFYFLKEKTKSKAA